MNDNTQQEILDTLANASRILVLQGENPDGDSLASALALEEIFESAGKTVLMFCAVDIPKHLRYLQGWDRVTRDFPRQFDATIIVDTVSEALLERTFTDGNIGIIRAKPLIVIDHHDVEGSLPVPALEYISTTAAATGEAIFALLGNTYEISLDAKKLLTTSILYDTRGMSTSATSPATLRLVADFVEAGVDLAELDEARMAMNRRDEDISRYKGELLQRVEYDFDSGLATVDITWDEIEKYSDRYNPAVLILDEMRLVNGVKLAIAYKTYPDGKILAKIRSNFEAPVASELAEHFTGGGHPHAAGFKLRGEDFGEVKKRVAAEYRRLMDRYEQSEPDHA